MQDTSYHPGNPVGNGHRDTPAGCSGDQLPLFNAPTSPPVEHGASGEQLTALERRLFDLLAERAAAKLPYCSATSAADALGHPACSVRQARRNLERKGYISVSRPNGQPISVSIIRREAAPTGGVPVNRTDHKASPMTISRGATVLLEYLARMCNGGTICQSSAAQIAAATGLPAESITGLRRELVAAGLVVLGRPLGSAPQITLATWHCSAHGPISLAIREGLVVATIAAAAADLSQIVRAFSEIGDEGRASAAAGLLERMRQAQMELRGADVTPG